MSRLSAPKRRLLSQMPILVPEWYGTPDSINIVDYFRIEQRRRNKETPFFFYNHHSDKPNKNVSAP